MMIMRCIKFKRIFAVLCAVLALAIADSASALVVEVSDAEELYWALNNVYSGTIKIAPGDYDITKLIDDAEGYALVEAEGLEIIGAGIGKTNVVISDPDPTVLQIRDCTDLKISGITIGHVPTGGDYDCAGHALCIFSSERVTLEGVDLFGCGVDGLGLHECKDVSVVDSIIRDCTRSLVWITGSSGVRFSKTRFRHREDADEVALRVWSEDRSEMTFEDCDFAIPQAKFIDPNNDRQDAVFTGTTFYGGPREEDLASIASARQSIRFEGSIFKSADEPGIVDHFGGPDPNGGR